MNKFIVTIPPMASSEVVELKFKYNIGDFFSERMVSLYISTFSDSTQIFTNRYGGVIGFGKFKKVKTNMIYVELNENPYYETSKFKFITENDLNYID